MSARKLCSVCLLLVLSAVAVSASAQKPQPTAEQDAIYAYTDDRGRLVHVQRLQDVPLNLRSSARRVDVSDDAARDGGALARAGTWLDRLTGQRAGGAEEAVLYRYRGARGQPVYTNLLTSVPRAQRAKARIDLRHVSLHSELGNALNRELQRRFDELRTSQACVQLRSDAALPLWQRAWREQRPLVVCAAVLLVLLLCTPWMLKRGWGAPWARVLWTATPLLGFVGLSAYLLTKTQASLNALSPRAQRCEPAAFVAAPDLPQRFALVSALEAEQRAIAQVAREARD